MARILILCLWLVACTRSEPVVCPAPEPEVIHVTPRCPACPSQVCPDITEIQVKCYEAVMQQVDRTIECRNDIEFKNFRLRDLQEDVDRWQKMYYEYECSSSDE